MFCPGTRMILIVDYEPRTTELLRGLLLSLGHDVEVSPNGEDAEARFNDLKPDAIIAELMIPRKPGIELIRSIRKSPHGKDVPVIMMCSKFGSKRYRPTVMKELRALAFLEKPFDAETLRDQLTEFIPPAPKPVLEGPVKTAAPSPITPRAVAPPAPAVPAAPAAPAATKAPDKTESEISDRLDELFSGI